MVSKVDKSGKSTQTLKQKTTLYMGYFSTPASPLAFKGSNQKLV